MNETLDIAHTSSPALAVREPLQLDLEAVESARRGATVIGVQAPLPGTWQNDVLLLLNDALATEVVCGLRYRRHHFTAQGLASPKIAEEFLAHANEEAAHADRLAQRIVQLGGKPDFSPHTLVLRSHAGYDESIELRAMIKANLVAERVAIECYGQMILLVGDKDSTTRRLLEDILSDEQVHAEELKDWLGDQEQGDGTEASWRL
jgi:bacterioferritin